MSNPMKGLVDFEAGGKNYTMAVNYNVICDAQKALGGTLDLKGPDEIRTFFHCALRRHQRTMTLEQAGDLIDELGAVEVGRMIGEAMVSAGYGQVDDEGGGSSPQTAA
jgi:hypothetical protein